MTLEKTTEDVLRRAIQNENEAYEIYTRAIHLAQDERIKKWLRRAAQEELKHKAALERLLANPEVLHTGLRRIGQVVAQNDRSGEHIAFITLRPDSTFHDLCLFARRKEQQAYELYRNMAEKYEGEIRTLLDMLAEEELRHERALRGWCEGIIE
jgi:rubrerythrin